MGLVGPGVFLDQKLFDAKKRVLPRQNASEKNPLDMHDVLLIWLKCKSFGNVCAACQRFAPWRRFAAPWGSSFAAATAPLRGAFGAFGADFEAKQAERRKLVYLW